jgi:hypothetical protein
MRGFKFMAVSVLGAGALLAGCTSNSGARSEPTTNAAITHARKPSMGMSGSRRMGDMCPMHVQGTTTTVADMEGGVALDFKTTTGDVGQLRQRVRGVAEMRAHDHAAGGMMMSGHGTGGVDPAHEHGAGPAPGREAGHQGGGMMGGGMMGGGMMGGGMMGGGMMGPAATAAVEEIDGGARIVLRPKDPGQLEALRAHARMRADSMARGECPMMSAGAQKPAQPPASASDAGHEAHHPPEK